MDSRFAIRNPAEEDEQDLEADDAVEIFEQTITLESANEYVGLIRNPTIRKVDMRDSHFRSDVFGMLLMAIQQNDAIESIYLGSNNLGPRGAEQVARELLSPVPLKATTNKSSSAGSSSFHLPTEALSSGHMMVLPMLSMLYLGSNSIGPEGARAICPRIVHSFIATLDLRKNAIGAEGAAYIADMIQTSKHLTNLDLRKNELGKDGCALIAKALEHRDQHGEVASLTALNLDSNNISSEGAIALAQAITVNRNLIWLSVQFNKINSDGCVAIAQALSASTSPTAPALSAVATGRSNRFGNSNSNILDNDEGAVASIVIDSARTTGRATGRTNRNAFYRCSSIEFLDLMGNKMGDEGAIAIGNMLSNNTILTCLMASNNHINESGFIGLAYGLSNNNTLKELDISGNHNTAESDKAIAQSLLSKYREDRSISALESLVGIDLSSEEILVSLELMRGNSSKSNHSTEAEVVEDGVDYSSMDNTEILLALRDKQQ